MPVSTGAPGSVTSAMRRVTELAASSVSVRRIRVLALVSISAFVAACSPDTAHRTIGAQPTDMHSAVAGMHAPYGAIILGVGPLETRINLVAVRASGRPMRLTALRRGVSWLAGADDRIVLAAPVEIYDHVLEYRAGKLVELDRNPAYTPEVGPGGVAYRGHSAQHPSRISLMIRSRRGTRAVRRLDFDGDTLFGWDAKRIGVLHGQDHRTERMLIISATTGRTVKIVRAPRAAHALWRPGTPIVYDDGRQRTGGTIVDLGANRRRRVPRGWHPLAWSPRSPRRLLVTDGHHLGLVDPDRPADVNRLAGRSTEPIRTAAWLSHCPKLSPHPVTTADIVTHSAQVDR